MGTRHLICAMIDGDFKIAQYGQWDGYPDGQGVTVCKFIRSADLSKFKENLRACTWINDEQDALVEACGQNWKTVYPHLSRDAGAQILAMVNESPLFLKDARGFAGDSCMCEWAYVLDFDNDVLEVYRGFNREKTGQESRFPSGAKWLENGGGYEPVKLVKSYKFSEIPDDEQFVNDLCSANVDA